MYVPFSIINFTPDSFSDGGEFFSESAVYERISFLKKIGVRYFDIGAQSTAPSNPDVGYDEELYRIKSVLTPSILNLLGDCYISVDTFRPGIIFYVLGLIKNYNLKGILWNDVSGVLCSEVEKYLNYSKNCRYIFCHNNSPSRESTCGHMDFVEDINGPLLIKSVANYFRGNLSTIASKHYSQIVFDTCFGFSKTASQNYTLINNHHVLECSLPEIKNWVIGISRKSFLRKLIPDDASFGHGETVFKQSMSLLETYGVYNYFRGNCNYYIRSHMPENFILYNKFDMILNT